MKPRRARTPTFSTTKKDEDNFVDTREVQHHSAAAPTSLLWAAASAHDRASSTSTVLSRISVRREASEPAKMPGVPNPDGEGLVETEWLPETADCQRMAMLVCGRRARFTYTSGPPVVLVMIVHGGFGALGVPLGSRSVWTCKILHMLRLERAGGSDVAYAWAPGFSSWLAERCDPRRDKARPLFARLRGEERVLVDDLG